MRMNRIATKVVRYGLGSVGASVYPTNKPPRGLDAVRDAMRFLCGDGARTNRGLDKAGNRYVFFDVGANQGQTIEEILERFPEARIEAFEPFPAAFKQLKSVADSHPNVTCHNTALGDSPGVLELPEVPLSTTNSLVNSQSAKDDADAKTVQIKVETIDGILDRIGVEHIHVLKTDTEGYDLHVLRGAEQAIADGRIDCILSEAGGKPAFEGQTSLIGLLEWARDHRYYLGGVYDQQWLLSPHSPHSFCNVLLVHERLLSERQMSKGIAR